jgi:hypothetical protein
LTAKLTADEVPPPGAGLDTVTFTFSPVATSAALIDAVNWDPLTKVVERALPPHCTVELELNPLPFTVSVKAPDPAAADAGEIELIVGEGFC